MSIDAIKCPKCKQPLPDQFMNTGIRNCTFCGKSVGLRVFPALFRKSEKLTPDNRHAEEGESSCFYHENLNASVHCDSCGRFLCDLCRVDMNGENICPSCIMAKRDSGKIGNLEKRRPLHSRTAMIAALVGLPLLLLFVGQVVAIIYVVKCYLQKPPAYSSGLGEKLTGTFAGVISLVAIVLGLLYWGNKIYN